MGTDFSRECWDPQQRHGGPPPPGHWFRWPAAPRLWMYSRLAAVEERPDQELPTWPRPDVASATAAGPVQVLTAVDDRRAATRLAEWIWTCPLEAYWRQVAKPSDIDDHVDDVHDGQAADQHRSLTSSPSSLPPWSLPRVQSWVARDWPRSWPLWPCQLAQDTGPGPGPGPGTGRCSRGSTSWHPGTWSATERHTVEQAMAALLWVHQHGTASTVPVLVMPVRSGDLTVTVRLTGGAGHGPG